MDEARIIRAGEITIRRAILKNFLPGPEREKRLHWLAQAAIHAPIIVTAAGSSTIVHKVTR
jgi:hypothetical protein